MSSEQCPNQPFSCYTSNSSAVGAGQPITPQLPSAGQAEFGFRNSLQYADTLEQVISAYQQGQITANEAHNQVEVADRFATTRFTQ